MIYFGRMGEGEGVNRERVGRLFPIVKSSDQTSAGNDSVTIGVLKLEDTCEYFREDEERRPNRHESGLALHVE